ncbi:hypothetical protein C5167_047648 [Papaver somniferum]|uniref:Uncharacterized protein n=1 Tax=Papaver somniferum TaxID=3469 RepID=A0A4Y7LKW0_PAPSO|nr:uncharacterized protein LOC113321161 [Papaver somniferum]RZC84861.1 hypothetical protein C5167_047648 [Papaver somniferum]
MAKNTLSPFFFGLLFLVLIPFISRQGGGVSSQSTKNYCNPGTGSPFGYRVQQNTCFGCNSYCQSLALPVGSPRNSGVQSGTCFQVAAPGPVSQYVCLCCVA